jgi:hypothetical protein
VQLRFFPLNNDLNPLPIAQSIKNEMKKIGSKNANTVFKSPDSKEGVQNMLEKTAGLAKTTMRIIDSEGKEESIKEDKFSSNIRVKFSRDILPSDDDYFISTAVKDKVINNVSEENKSLYERFTGILQRLML